MARRAPRFTTQVIDGEEAVRVMTTSGQVLGTVRYLKQHKGLVAGWAVDGCVVPPLSTRFEERDDAIANLVEHRLDKDGNRRNLQ